MKVQYLADDGTIFNTESDCINYEQREPISSDPRFVNIVDSILDHLTTSSDVLGTRVIYFENDEDKLKVSKALAANIGDLLTVYNTIEEELVAEARMHRG